MYGLYRAKDLWGLGSRVWGFRQVLFSGFGLLGNGFRVKVLRV